MKIIISIKYIMDILKKMDLKFSSVLKIAGIVLASLFVVFFVLGLVRTSFQTMSLDSATPSFPQYGYGGGAEEKLSLRNVVGSIAMPLIDGGVTTGDDSEEFEVTQYSTNIETRDLADTCSSITTLKGRKDVIFENANEYDRGCNYTFKVKRESVEEILLIIKDLEPKDLSENTHTIKKLIDDFTSEKEILENKLDSINDTLKKAVASYDDITSLATRVKDVESLTKIIDSKINIVERLTKEKIKVSSELERIERSKADSLDRILYTYFNINISENKFIDWEYLSDSWKDSTRSFVRDINRILQDTTITLVLFLAVVLQWSLYILIIVIFVKHGWKIIKKIWNN